MRRRGRSTLAIHIRTHMHCEGRSRYIQVGAVQFVGEIAADKEEVDGIGRRTEGVMQTCVAKIY